MPFLPVPDAGVPFARAFRFHSPKADFQMNFAFAPLITIPIVAAHSKVSELLEISRARQRQCKCVPTL
jgi:hypothetical protein